MYMLCTTELVVSLVSTIVDNQTSCNYLATNSNTNIVSGGTYNIAQSVGPQLGMARHNLRLSQNIVMPQYCATRSGLMSDFNIMDTGIILVFGAGISIALETNLYLLSRGS